MKSFVEIDNESLVKECVRGNPDAFGLFYSRHAPKMYSVVRRYVANPQDAEDVLHDGFVVAFSRLNTLRDAERVEHWLATIMRNLSLQFLQAQDLDSLLHEIPDVEDTPEFDNIIDLNVLEELIRKLPPGYQTVFRLSVLENKTHKEIAKILGIAPNSSSSQLFHAKMMMRKLISEYRQKAEMLTLCLLLAAGIAIYMSKQPPEGQEKATDRTLTAISRRNIHEEQKTGTGIEPEMESTTRAGAKATAGLRRRPQHVSPTPSVPDREMSHTDSAVGTLYDVNKDPTNECEDIAAGHDLMAAYISEDSITSFQAMPSVCAIDEDPRPSAGTRRRRWAINIGVNNGATPAHELFTGGGLLDTSPGPSSPDHSVSDPNKPDEPDQSKSRATMDLKDIHHTNDIPITVAATLCKPIHEGIWLETGLTYTYLHSTFETGNRPVDCRWHYLGIPLKLNVDNYTNRRLRLYATASVGIELPLYSAATTSQNTNYQTGTDGGFHSPAVAWASIGYGLNLSINRHLGLFIEPSIRYIFNHDYEIPNAWTDDRTVISLPVGVRCNF